MSWNTRWTWSEEFWSADFFDPAIERDMVLAFNPRYWDGPNPKSSRTSGYQFQGHFILIHTDISDVWTWAAKIYQSLRDRHVDLTAPYGSRMPFCLHEWTRLKICDAGIGHRQKFTVSKIILTSNQEMFRLFRRLSCTHPLARANMRLKAFDSLNFCRTWKSRAFRALPSRWTRLRNSEASLVQEKPKKCCCSQLQKRWSFIPPYTTFMKIGDGLPLLYQHFPKFWQVLVTNRTHFHFPPSEAPRRRHVAPRHHWATKNFAGEKMRSSHGLVQNWYITIWCYMCVYYILTNI